MAFVPRIVKDLETHSRTMRRTARDVLNELRWREPSHLADAIIWVRDRNRPEGRRTIRGSDVVHLERRYLTTSGARLPYYKIERIELADELLFER